MCSCVVANCAALFPYVCFVREVDYVAGVEQFFLVLRQTRDLGVISRWSGGREEMWCVCLELLVSNSCLMTTECYSQVVACGSSF